MTKKKAATLPANKSHPRAVGKHDEDVGQRLRLRRVETGMSQETLAKRVGVSFQQVQKYEKGTNRIPTSRLMGMAAALGVSIDFFFGNNGKAQNEVESLLFLDSAFSLRLLRAYAAIKDQTVQRDFVSLMEKVAGIVKER